MNKILSLFQRNYDGDRLVRDEIVPGADWVVAGEGVATRKFDGTACLVRFGHLYKRFDAKQGKAPPPQFTPAQAPDQVTGHWPGWVPVGSGPEDQWHRAAFTGDEPNGTYELVGPKVQNNAEGFADHTLVRHGASVIPDAPRDYEGLKTFLQSAWIEGIVWHHPDGRMVKIKAKDFGWSRQPELVQ